MESSTTLIGLKERILAIIAYHGEGAAHVSQAVFTGGVDPSGSISYLTSEEFDFCLQNSYLVRWKQIGVNSTVENITVPESPE